MIESRTTGLCFAMAVIYSCMGRTSFFFCWYTKKDICFRINVITHTHSQSNKKKGADMKLGCSFLIWDGTDRADFSILGTLWCSLTHWPSRRFGLKTIIPLKRFGFATLLNWDGRRGCFSGPQMIIAFARLFGPSRLQRHLLASVSINFVYWNCQLSGGGTRFCDESKVIARKREIWKPSPED